MHEKDIQKKVHQLMLEPVQTELEDLITDMLSSNVLNCKQDNNPAQIVIAYILRMMVSPPTRVTWEHRITFMHVLNNAFDSIESYMEIIDPAKFHRGNHLWTKLLIYGHLTTVLKKAIRYEKN